MDEMICETTEVHEEKVHEAISGIPSDVVLADTAELFKVFGDPTRAKILFVLMNSELCVCDIATALGMQQSAISHQLRVLKQASLVKNRRDGKTIYYSLADSHVKTILYQGVEHVTE